MWSRNPKLQGDGGGQWVGGISENIWGEFCPSLAKIEVLAESPRCHQWFPCCIQEPSTLYAAKGGKKGISGHPAKVRARAKSLNREFKRYLRSCRRSETQPFRTKWSFVQNQVKLRFWSVPGNPFARNGCWMSKTEEKRTKSTLDVKNWGKNCNFEVSRATFTHEMDVGRQKLRKKLRLWVVPYNTKWLDVKNWGKLRFYMFPYTRNGRWTSKTKEKMRFYLVNRNAFVCVKVSVCKSLCV